MRNNTLIRIGNSNNNNNNNLSIYVFEIMSENGDSQISLSYSQMRFFPVLFSQESLLLNVFIDCFYHISSSLYDKVSVLS